MKYFEQASEKAELARFGQAELDNYEYSLKVFRDNKAVFDYATTTAFDEGKSVRNIEVGRTLKKRGVPIDIIIEATVLSKNEIDKL